MFAFVPIVERPIDSLNTARKGALKSHIFGAPKAGDRWNVPVLGDGVCTRLRSPEHSRLLDYVNDSPNSTRKFVCCSRPPPNKRRTADR